MKKIFKTLILLLLPVTGIAQLTPVTNQYILNPLTINPAFAGNRGALNIATFYRRQWVGVTGSPQTMTLSLDAPFLDSKLGLGLMITNDKIGVTKQTQFMSSYAYRMKIGEGTFSLGLGAGIMTTNTAWSDLVVLDPGDDYYLIDSRVFVVPDFSFGAYYSTQNYFAGLSIPKLLGYSFDFDRNRYSLKVNPGQYYYLLSTGYLFNLSQRVKLLPSVLVTLSAGEKILYDINAHVSVIDRFWLGASYRNSRSVAALFQFSVNDQLKVGYTYDFDFGKLGRYSNGSHEVMLRYQFSYKVDAVNPLIF
jgi:type IX secretion system PorP/SprF family membrane protein